MSLRENLQKQHYGIIGEHSAIQICRWTKKSLLNDGVCYKEKFYGINSHGCCQISPWIVCENSCLHCWRPVENDREKVIFDNFDSPEKIIEEAIKMQRKLITGFKGNEKVNKKKFLEAQNPSQFALSLIGEAILYPKLGEMIKILRNKKISTFLVTNGLYPEKLKELGKNLPTQLYVSLNSPNKEKYEIWHRSKVKDAWEKFNETLKLLKKLKTRTVIRMTLVKDENMDNEEEYSKLILKGEPDFIEVKGFMSVGYARKRFGYEKMPNHQEIKEFSLKLLKFLPEYKILDEHEFSRVILLGKNKGKMKIKRSEI